MRSLGLGKTKSFLFSDSAITVYSAVVATPVVLTFAARFQIARFPAWIWLSVLGFIFFTLSMKLGGYLKPICTGVSLGFFLNAFMSVPFFSSLTGRLSGLARGS